MTGKEGFRIISALQLLPIVFLFAYVAISETAEPIPKPPAASSNSSVVDAATTPHHPRSDDMELPYFFILQLPNLLSDEPAWSDWGPWSPCPTGCGPPSKRSRRRHCQAAIESACSGESVQWMGCDRTPCSSERPKVAQEVVRTGSKMEGNEKLEMEVAAEVGLVEAIGEEEADALRKKAEMALELEKQFLSMSASKASVERPWTACPRPCPYTLQVRRRWCYLGQYCVGVTREMRICGPEDQRQGVVVTCGMVNTTDLIEFSEPLNHSSPWTDPHTGWSPWTLWSSCSSDDCGYQLQALNESRPCSSQAGLVNCHGQHELMRVCREQSETTGLESSICGRVEDIEHWTMIEQPSIEHRYFFPSSSRLIHAIVIFVLFAPPIILLFYWLVSRANKHRYETLPSAASGAGSSAVDANGHPTISADVTSALGPNHLTLEPATNDWKTV